MTVKYFQNFKVSAYTRVTGSKLFPTYTDVRQVRNFQHWRDSLDNPKWRAQIENNENACTVFSAERKELVSQPGGPYALLYGGTYPYTDVNRQETYGDYYGYKASMLPYDAADYQVSTADNLALAKFLAELKATRQKMAGGVFLGELRETMAMIRNPFKGLFKALNNHLDRTFALNKKFRSYRKQLDRVKLQNRVNEASIRREYLEALRSEYLNFQFGVKPLINDIRDGVKAYQELLGEDDENPLHDAANLKGVGKWQNVTQTTIDTDYGNGFLFTKETDRRSWECIVVYRGKTKSSLSCSAPSGAFDKVIDVLGFGPEQWLPTLWELIPYSWVIDYFTNVGQILESITTRRDDLAWYNRTVITVRSEFIQGVPDIKRVKATVSPIHSLNYSDLGWALSVTSRVMRAPMTDFLKFPTLEFKYPPAESLKWMNLSAVVAGFRRIKPL